MQRLLESDLVAAKDSNGCSQALIASVSNFTPFRPLCACVFGEWLHALDSLRCLEKISTRGGCASCLLCSNTRHVCAHGPFSAPLRCSIVSAHAQQRCLMMTHPPSRIFLLQADINFARRTDRATALWIASSNGSFVAPALVGDRDGLTRLIHLHGGCIRS